MTPKLIAYALTRLSAPFSYRRWLVVENVSWGWGLDWEADMICVGKTGYADEVEIKVNPYDLLHDYAKAKWAKPDPRIRRFWYAVPPDLVPLAEQHVKPEHGILMAQIVQGNHGRRFETKIIRPAKPRPDARKISEAEMVTLGRLGQMRYWDRTAGSIYGIAEP